MNGDAEGFFSPGVAPIMFLVVKSALGFSIALVLILMAIDDWAQMWQVYCFLFCAVGLLASMFWLESVLEEINRGENELAEKKES